MSDIFIPVHPVLTSQDPQEILQATQQRADYISAKLWDLISGPYRRKPGATSHYCNYVIHPDAITRVTNYSTNPQFFVCLQVPTNDYLREDPLADETLIDSMFSHLIALGLTTTEELQSLKSQVVANRGVPVLLLNYFPLLYRGSGMDYQQMDADGWFPSYI